MNEFTTNRSLHLILLIGLMAILGGYIAYEMYTATFGTDLSKDHTKWAEAGSFFGGILGSGFAFLALLTLLATLAIQQAELRETRAVLNKQSTDSTFFQMMSLYNEVLNNIEVTEEVVKHNTLRRVNRTSRDAFLAFHNIFSSQYLLKAMRGDYPDLETNIEKVRKAYDDFHQEYGQKIGHYYRLLYNTVKLIENSSINATDKKNYVNILRSQLSKYETSMLFFNCLGSLGKDRFLPLANKYDLFKHLDSESLADYIPLAEEGHRAQVGKDLLENITAEFKDNN